MAVTEQAREVSACPKACADKDCIIHVDCASHIYPDGTLGIHDMCFSVCRQEIVALCGANGSGKSTLLEHLNGLMTPSSGHVYVMGKPCSEIRKMVWRYVGLVFQRPEDQLFAPTVLDDVMFGPINLGMSKEEARVAALGALEKVGAAGLAGKIPNYLSGDQGRRPLQGQGDLCPGPGKDQAGRPARHMPRMRVAVAGVLPSRARKAEYSGYVRGEKGKITLS